MPWLCLAKGVSSRSLGSFFYHLCTFKWLSCSVRRSQSSVFRRVLGCVNSPPRPEARTRNQRSTLHTIMQICLHNARPWPRVWYHKEAEVDKRHMIGAFWNRDNLNRRIKCTAKLQNPKRYVILGNIMHLFWLQGKVDTFDLWGNNSPRK